MTKRMKSAVFAAGLLAAVTAQTRPVAAAELIIDAFSAATAQPGTLINLDLGTENVFTNDPNNPVTATDMVSGVIGGTRQLIVTMLTCNFCGSDDVIAGVSPPDMALDYSSSPDADGVITLIYDANGTGLNQSLAFALGIRLPFVSIDPSSYPLTARITLTQGANSATSMATDNSGMTALNFDFPFSGFTNIDNIDLANLTRIEIIINPTDDMAGDLRLGPITTFGTPPFEPGIDCTDGIDNDNNGLIDCEDPACIASADPCRSAPAMSTGMMVLLIGILTICGSFGIAYLQPRAAIKVRR